MTLAIAAVSLWVLAAGPTAPTPTEAATDDKPLFSRPEPSIAGGAAALADGDAARALELYRKAKADSTDQRAIVEYDVGQAMVAQALASAALAPAAPSEPGQPPHAQAPQLDKTLVDDAQAAFTRARGLARDPRIKAEASLAAGNLAAFAGDVDSAIAQYRQALQDDPTNDRARKNLRRALEAKKQQPPPPQDGDGEKNDDKKDEDQKDEDQKDEDKKDEDKKGEPKAKPNGDQGEQDKKEEPPAPKPGSPEAQKAQKKEAARRLLDALRARERPLTPLEMRGAKPVRAKEGKDW